MKYPIGIQSFEKIREDGFVYVDKTEMIYSLVHDGTIYFLSRPRRFGKSLLISTLENYFLGRRELFRGLAIESLEKEWAEYPVFHIDFNGSNFTDPGSLDKKLEWYVSMWEDIFGKTDKDIGIGERFAFVLRQAHRQTGRRCVVLIDEYDKPLLDVLDTGYTITVGGSERLLEDWNREVLKGFYSVFKVADSDLQFVLLTGVTKFSQVSVFSGFNQPQDISMDSRYDALCGITQQELEQYFPEPIGTMAASYGESPEEMLSRLKRQYDGCYYSPEEFVDYKADVEKPLPMIYQSGYLTIKDCRARRGTFLLDFPNNEVKNGFVTLVASNYFNNRKVSVGGWIQDVLDAMEDGEPDSMRDLFTSFLADIPYTARRKENERERERYFQYTFYLIFKMISTYETLVEQPQSQGRADFIVETPKYVYIFEFKLDGSAEEALAQIEERGYTRPYASGPRPVYRIGASFSSATGTIGEWKTDRL